MSLKIKMKQEKDFEPVPEGTYPAVCYTIADIGMQYEAKFKKSSCQVIFIWEIADDDLRIDINGEMKRRAISKRYTASFNPKSNLYKDVRPWIGRDFTNEELEGVFDLGSLLGVPCLIGVSNDTGADGKVYANVVSVMQLPKGVKVDGPENPMVLYDIDESPEEELEKLPEWIQKMIAKSNEANIKQANSVDVDIDPETGEVVGDIDDMIEDAG